MRILRRTLFRTLIAPCALLPGACATLPGQPARPVDVGILAFNDFHGNLSPPQLAVDVPLENGDRAQVPAGGAAWLAGTIKALRSGHRFSLTVSAGDLIGASPLASALFLDEPTVTAMNRIGLDFSAVGNHEFDRGAQELERMQAGGCARFTALEPCQLERFAGARFGFLAANVTRADGTTLFPAAALRRFGHGNGRVSVGVIGLTLKGTDRLVSRAGTAGLTFSDEADAINRSVAALKARGADAVVVLLHQGGRLARPDLNGCDGLDGDIVPIVARLDPRVDLVVSGHTHAAYVCALPGRGPGGGPLLLTSAGFYGQMITDIRLTIDPVSHRVTGRSARNVIVQSPSFESARGPVPNRTDFAQTPPDRAIAAYLARYLTAAAGAIARPVGRLAAAVDRQGGPGAHDGGTLGNLIADAQLGATRNRGAQMAFINPFSIRAPFEIKPGADGMVTFGQIFSVQPFGNELVTMSLTGAEIRAALEQGLASETSWQALAPSAGLSYAVDHSAPAGNRVRDLTFEGHPLDPVQTYRVTVCRFLADGGDGFTAFTTGREVASGPTDVAAMEAWLGPASPAAAPRAAPLEKRVRLD